MAELNGTLIPDSVASRVNAVAEDPEAVRRVGIEIALELCRELLNGGVPGLHFFTMNSARSTVEIVTGLGLR